MFRPRNLLAFITIILVIGLIAGRGLLTDWGTAKFETAEYQSAGKILWWATVLDPFNAEAEFLLARVYMERGDVGLAEDELLPVKKSGLVQQAYLLQ